MLLLIVSTFWHLQLGLQVVIEDYVHEEGSKLLLRSSCSISSPSLGAALAIFAVLKIAFGGSAA